MHTVQELGHEPHQDGFVIATGLDVQAIKALSVLIDLWILLVNDEYDLCTT